MDTNDATVVAVDTSVLINFLCIDRMDLIDFHSHTFVVTDYVAEEVENHYTDERKRLDAAIQSGVLREERVDARTLASTTGSSAASRRLGLGERSAITLAVSKGWPLAIDDRRATKEARKISPKLRILTTQDIVVSMIRENLLSIAKADRIKGIWSARFRFHLQIGSFADIM